MLACFIKLYCALTKCLAVMCFEATNNTCIKWLYKWGQIWLKEYNAYVSWFVANCVTTEIVDEKTDMAARLSHLDVKGLYPSNRCKCWSSGLPNQLLTLQIILLSSRPSCCYGNRSHEKQVFDS